MLPTLPATLRRCTIWCAAILTACLAVAPLAAQPSTIATIDPCALITRAALRRLGLPETLKGTRDSTGVTCRWGKAGERNALVVKTYASLAPDAMARMRIAAERTSDPILEPAVADGAWSMKESYGRVLMAGKNGKAVQLQRYVPPRRKANGRPDVTALNADRDALVAVARMALARL